MQGRRRIIAIVAGVAVGVGGPLAGAVIAQEGPGRSAPQDFEERQGQPGQRGLGQDMPDREPLQPLQPVRSQQFEVEVADFLESLEGSVDDAALAGLRGTFEQAGLLDEDFVVTGRPIGDPAAPQGDIGPLETGPDGPVQDDSPGADLRDGVADRLDDVRARLRGLEDELAGVAEELGL